MAFHQFETSLSEFRVTDLDTIIYKIQHILLRQGIWLHAFVRSFYKQLKQSFYGQCRRTGRLPHHRKKYIPFFLDKDSIFLLFFMIFRVCCLKRTGGARIDIRVRGSMDDTRINLEMFSKLWELHRFAHRSPSYAPTRPPQLRKILPFLLVGPSLLCAEMLY